MSASSKAFLAAAIALCPPRRGQPAVRAAWSSSTSLLMMRLNIRSDPSASSAVVDQLVPGQHGIIHLDGECRPLSISWGSRWCPVSHYNGDDVTKGWVKARFVRDSDCP